jgi:hypothetical protein
MSRFNSAMGMAARAGGAGLGASSARTAANAISTPAASKAQHECAPGGDAPGFWWTAPAEHSDDGAFGRQGREGGKRRRATPAAAVHALRGQSSVVRMPA